MKSYPKYYNSFQQDMESILSDEEESTSCASSTSLEDDSDSSCMSEDSDNSCSLEPIVKKVTPFTLQNDKKRRYKEKEEVKTTPKKQARKQTSQKTCIATVHPYTKDGSEQKPKVEKAIKKR